MAYQNSNSQKILDDLRVAIMQGVYKPRERLMERQLAKRYGVSRTPIREAIRKLEGMGLVHISPHQGAKVVDFSREDVENLYSLRQLLEQHAAKIACSVISAEEINSLTTINKGLLQAVSSRNIQKMIESDQQFHLTLCRACRNTFLIKEIEDFRLKSYPLSYFFWSEISDFQKSASEHKGIIKALKAKDATKLQILVKKNVGKPKLRYLRYLSTVCLSA